jgi:hypothetical protein
MQKLEWLTRTPFWHPDVKRLRAEAADRTAFSVTPSTLEQFADTLAQLLRMHLVRG